MRARPFSIASHYTYDIADSRRLRRVTGELEQAGTRMQRSVFECGVTHEGLRLLRARIVQHIEPGEDRVLYQPICSRCRIGIAFQGRLPPVGTEPFWVV